MTDLLKNDTRSRRKSFLIGGVCVIGVIGVGGSLLNDYRHKSERAETRRAASQIIAAVRAWHILHGDKACPTMRQLVEARQVDAKTLRNDPWGQIYNLRCSDLEVIVTSSGPDGKDRTGDDIEVREPAAAVTNPE
jgi:hypothetical protein